MDTKMPVIFVGHGSPMNAIEENTYTHIWKEIGKSLIKPRAILIFSAHWITEYETRISTSEHPQMIYDMWGFPPELYQIQYNAPGSANIAGEIFNLLSEGNFNILWDSHRGFDHGIWSVLIHMFPDANIPVISLSLDYFSWTKSLFELGQKLASLREKWIFIMGSGNIVHNLRTMNFSETSSYPWAREFDKRITENILTRNYENILSFQSWWDISRYAHPTYDHLLPLFPLLWTLWDNEKVEFFNEWIDLGSISMRSMIWR